MSKTGFIPTEDFALALDLLNAPVAINVLRDIPTVPDGPGLVAYAPIIDLVLHNEAVRSSGLGLTKRLRVMEFETAYVKRTPHATTSGGLSSLSVNGVGTHKGGSSSIHNSKVRLFTARISSCHTLSYRIMVHSLIRCIIMTYPLIIYYYPPIGLLCLILTQPQP